MLSDLERIDEGVTKGLNVESTINHAKLCMCLTQKMSMGGGKCAFLKS
jgi:hypothetical protein